MLDFLCRRLLNSFSLITRSNVAAVKFLAPERLITWFRFLSTLIKRLFFCKINQDDPIFDACEQADAVAAVSLILKR